MPKVAYPFGMYPNDWLVMLPPGSVWAVWGALWFYKGRKKPVSWASARKIATLTGLAMSKVKKALLWLKANGYVAIERQGGGRLSTRYQLIWHSKMPAMRLAAKLVEMDTHPQKGTAAIPVWGRLPSPKGDTLVRVSCSEIVSTSVDTPPAPLAGTLLGMIPIQITPQHPSQEKPHGAS